MSNFSSTVTTFTFAQIAKLTARRLALFPFMQFQGIERCWLDTTRTNKEGCRPFGDIISFLEIFRLFLQFGQNAMSSLAQEGSLATTPWLVTMFHLPHAIKARLHVHNADVVILATETTAQFEQKSILVGKIFYRIRFYGCYPVRDTVDLLPCGLHLLASLTWNYEESMASMVLRVRSTSSRFPINISKPLHSTPSMSCPWG